MMKKWFLIIFASVTLGTVWSIVIFQLVTGQETVMQGRVLSSLERNTLAKQKMGSLGNWDAKIVRSVKLSDQPIHISKKDLSKIDFSDFDTSDGVPIDIILKRLELEK